MNLDETQSFDETMSGSHAPVGAPPRDEIPPGLLRRRAPGPLGGAVTRLRALLRGRSQSSDWFGMLAQLSNPRTFKAVGTSRAALAEFSGYVSELEFFEDSQPIASKDAYSWFATPDKVHGGWVIWCDREAAT